jgi:hypothetical protein
MDFETLLRRYDALLAENEALKEENLSLKIQLGLAEPLERTPLTESAEQEVSLVETPSLVTATADPADKIRLFMSLFKGREDLYAKAKGGRARMAPRLDTHPSVKMKENLVFAGSLRSSVPHATTDPTHPCMKRPSTPI